MSTKQKKMALSTLKAMLASEKADALAAMSAAQLSGERARAIEYYLGEMGADMPVPEGRSRAVSSDVADTVEGLMPSLMDIFCGSDEVVRFEPVGPEDEAAAQQESDYVNHVFMQQNPGFMVMYAFSDGAFYLRGGSPYPYLIPLGGILPYVGSSVPNSAFALPYGQAISRSTYVALFSLVGTTFGTGDGSTTFNIPDLRGRVVAGLDNMGGSNAARLSTAMTSTSMGNSGGAQNQTIAQANLPNVNFTVSGIALSQSFAFQGTSQPAFGGGGNGFPYVSGIGSPNVTSVDEWLTSTTPVSISSQGSAASGGSGTSLTTTQPTMVMNFILRVI